MNSGRTDNPAIRDADLERVLSADFEASVVASTPAVLRARLRRTSEVGRLLDRFDAGEIDQATIRSFVSRLLREHPDARLFPHQAALAAIAVMLEQRFSPFADEYLRDLARVRSSRLAMASGVARLGLKARRRHAVSEVRLLQSGGEIPAQARLTVRFECGQRDLKRPNGTLTVARV